MESDERIRFLIEQGRRRVPISMEPNLGGVLARYRRRRARRYAVSAVAAVVVAAGIAAPLLLLRHVSREAAPGTELSRFGLSVRIPDGWNGRVYLSRGRGPLMVMANRPLTDWYPSSPRFFPHYPVVAAAGPASRAGEIVLALWEFPPDTMQPSDAYPGAQLPLAIRRGDLIACGNKGCAVRRFAVGARHFLLIATLATRAVTSVPGGTPLSPARYVPDSALESANAILGTLHVEASGYELGLGCSPHGTRLEVTTPSDGRIGFEPQCLAAPTGTPFTIVFRNRLATTGGQQGIPAGITIFPNEAEAYALEISVRSSSTQDALFVGREVESPGRAVYHVPALPPGIYFVTGPVYLRSIGVLMVR